MNGLVNSSLFSPLSIAKTTKAIEELQTIAGTDNKDLIQAKIEELNEITKPFSERIMDLAVRTAMKGKKI